jgi:ABC-2 type transport system ATP-binding protein
MELELKNLSKYYRSIKALDDVSCTLCEGIYGLLGPNGAGKTTMMNLIVDNILPTKGEVLFNGANVHEMGEAFRERLGYMPQQQALYTQFTAREFLGYMAALKGMNRKAAKKRIEEALDRVNLSKEADLRLGGFSGGMKQRVLIAQAIINDPDVLIMDEPTAGLDPKERIRIRNLISEIAFKKIVIIATHVVPDIEFISKEILLLKEGRLLAKALQEELVKAMEGKVYEIRTPEEDMHGLMSAYKVCSINKDRDSVVTRIISEVPPAFEACREVKPTLEDLYLHVFDTYSPSAAGEGGEA